MADDVAPITYVCTLEMLVAESASERSASEQYQYFGSESVTAPQFENHFPSLFLLLISLPRLRSAIEST